MKTVVRWWFVEELSREYTESVSGSRFRFQLLALASKRWIDTVSELPLRCVTTCSSISERYRWIVPKVKVFRFAANS